MKSLTEGELAGGYSLGVRRPWMAREGHVVYLPVERRLPAGDRRTQWRESKRYRRARERVAA